MSSFLEREPDAAPPAALDGSRPAAEKAAEELVVWAGALDFKGRLPSKAAAALEERKVTRYPTDDPPAVHR
ncbi:MAG TPA: hypothetical protein VK395_34300 [Gemmataceae bacterium]|nr:hypothetical protein [Gemmataceae bacterium]